MNAFNLDQAKILWFVELTREKNSTLSVLKAFADDNINLTKNLKFALGRAENIVGKKENAAFLHFPFFHNVFKRLLT